MLSNKTVPALSAACLLTLAALAAPLHGNPQASAPQQPSAPRSLQVPPAQHSTPAQQPLRNPHSQPGHPATPGAPRSASAAQAAQPIHPRQAAPSGHSGQAADAAPIPTISPEEAVKALSGAEPLKPLRGIAETGFWQAHGVSVGIGVVVAALLIALAYWLYRRAKNRPVAVDPRQRALDSIREAAAIADSRTFASGVSDALRLYLEARCNLRAPEQTTEEFLQSARASSALPADSVAALESFLTLCDLAKFARQGLDASQRESLASYAVSLIEQTSAPQPDPRQSAPGQTQPQSQPQPTSGDGTSTPGTRT